MMRNRLLGVAVAVGLLGWGPANAAVVWTLDPTTNNDGNTVAASATFSAVGDVVTIDLTNLSPSLSAANQALSDLIVDLTTDLTSVSGLTQAGQLENVNSNGTTTPVSGSPTRWHASINSSENLFLTALGGGQPSNMIAPATIGSPNASVLNFNPYIDTTAVFTLTLPGASHLTISGVKFSFGTSDTEFVANGHCTGNCPTINPLGGVPEPGTWALMILGFGGAGAMLRRRGRGWAKFAG